MKRRGARGHAAIARPAARFAAGSSVKSERPVHHRQGATQASHQPRGRDAQDAVRGRRYRGGAALRSGGGERHHRHQHDRRARHPQRTWPGRKGDGTDRLHARRAHLDRCLCQPADHRSPRPQSVEEPLHRRGSALAGQGARSPRDPLRERRWGCLCRRDHAKRIARQRQAEMVRARRRGRGPDPRLRRRGGVMRTGFLFEHAWLHGMTRREAFESGGQGWSASAPSPVLASLPERVRWTRVLAGAGEGPSERFSDEMFDVEAVAGRSVGRHRVLPARRPARDPPGGDAQEDARGAEGARQGQAHRHLQPGRAHVQRLSRLPEHPAAALQPAPARCSATTRRPATTASSSRRRPWARTGSARTRSASSHRAAYTYSYQIGTQLDNLNHIGVGPVFYGGHRGPESPRPGARAGSGPSTWARS